MLQGEHVRPAARLFSRAGMAMRKRVVVQEASCPPLQLATLARYQLVSLFGQQQQVEATSV
jgi:hypothetical protein